MKDLSVDIGDVIAGWQTKLLQLDRRNSLLYFRGQRSAVNLLSTNPDQLLDRLQRSRAGLKFPYAEPRRRAGGLEEEADDARQEHGLAGDLATDYAPLPLQRRLLNLHRQEREWEEEQGVNVLYVALGFLRWIDEEGETARSPLLLAPVELERDSSRDPWRLKLEDDDLQVNETLRHQLRTFGVTLPEYEHETPSAYLAEFGQLIAQKQGWAVEATALALATFPFVKLAMWEDLDQMRRRGTKHPVVCALAGDRQALRPSAGQASARLPEGDDLHGGGLDDLLPVKEQFTVLPADHSQLRAIELARRGCHLVIHGPPGTGKSQTIANIIASYLADGKRVLFVSEKTAALDIVKKRLEECELGCFCLDLHSSRARKASVYEQLRRSMEEPRTGSEDFPLDKLEEQRSRLNAVARALHEVRSPLGLSVFQVHGRFARVRSLKRVEFPLCRVDELSAEDLEAVVEATARIARRGAEFESHATSPWRSLRCTLPGVELADELRQAAGRMREAVTRIQAAGEESVWLGLPPPGTIGDIDAAGKIAGHMAGCPGIPEAWLSRHVLERLDRRAADLASLQAERRRLEEALEPVFGSELPRLAFADLKERLEVSPREAGRLAAALGPGWEARLCPRPDLCEGELRLAAERTRGLWEAALRVADSVGASSGFKDHLIQVRQLARTLRSALGTPAAPASWFEPGGLSAARAQLARARGQLAELEDAERRLFADFDEELLDQVSPAMLVRYRTDHQSRWRWLRKSYRSDRRVLQGCLRRPRKLSLTESLHGVEAALRVRNLRADWQSASEVYASSFGSRFSGRPTDWPALAAAIDGIEAWMQGWEWGLESARRCYAGDRTALEPPLRDLEAALAQWEESALASRDAAPDLSLTARQGVLEAAGEAVARLVAGGDPLWPCLRKGVACWADLLQALGQAIQLRKVQADEEAVAPALRQDFAGYYEGPESDWQAVRAAIQWAGELLRLAGSRIPAALIAHCRRPHPPERYISLRQRLDDALLAFRAQADRFTESFDPRPAGWATWEAPAFEQLVPWLSWIEQHADSASAWLEYRGAVRDLEASLAPGAVDALREATDDASLVPDLVLRRIYAAWMAKIYERDARLRCEPRDLEALRDEFRKLDLRFLHANRARIRKQCFRRYPDRYGSAIELGQMGILNRQLSLKRRQMPVRRLLQEIPQLLQALKPCLLMSPVAVSQYLQNGVLATDRVDFDAVVFDEASQVFPHDAVPAIERARQVVVVGDEKQLPPTSFFRSDYLDEEAEEEVVEDRLEAWRASCTRWPVCKGQESTTPTWTSTTGAGTKI